MAPADWNDPNARSLSLYLDGDDDPDPAPDGTPLTDDDFLFIVNGWWEPLDFVIPSTRPGQGWYVEIETFGGTARARTARWQYIDSWPAVGRRTSRPYREQELGPNGARDIVKVRRARNARRFLLLRVCSGRRYAAPIVNAGHR